MKETEYAQVGNRGCFLLIFETLYALTIVLSYLKREFSSLLKSGSECWSLQTVYFECSLLPSVLVTQLTATILSRWMKRVNFLVK